MKISNEFFIEQIRSVRKLIEAQGVKDETAIVYAIMIDTHILMSVYGDFDKLVNICFNILFDVFDNDPSSFMPAMLQFIEHFINNHSSEKIKGDPS